MAVTSALRPTLYILGLLGVSLAVQAAVLPEDRADALYHSYDGGGLEVSGPSLLIQKKAGNNFALNANYYVDTISSATIDVQLSGSRYAEERTQKSVGLNYLHGKSLMNLSYTNSVENDFTANTMAFGISQEMFGDLTTVSIGYSRGWDEVGARGTNTTWDNDRQNYRVSLTQVLTKNTIMAVNLETITDEGAKLNNPYREVRYLDSSAALGFSKQLEVYPRTRTSNALGIKAKYYLPYRAALHGEYRLYADSWGINGNIYELGYTHPFGEDWIFDIKYRIYSQTKADFYSDLFPYADAQNFLARDKELSTFSSQAIGFGVSYEFAKGEGGVIDKASVNFKIDHIEFEYDDFRDFRLAAIYGAGNEPLYRFSANAVQLFVSVWF